MSTVKRKNILELSFVLRGHKVKVSSDSLVKVCIAFANGSDVHVCMTQCSAADQSLPDFTTPCDV